MNVNGVVVRTGRAGETKIILNSKELSQKRVGFVY